MQEDGAPLRVHIESAARQGDIECRWRLDNPPPLSPFVAHLWGYYVDLSSTRSSGMGPNRLTRLEIQAWEQDEGIRLERWERRAIMALDALHLTIINEAKKA